MLVTSAVSCGVDKDILMLDIQHYSDLGQLKIDWLHAHYHFSFSNYHNPKRMGLGPLRVINDDIVSVGGGFDFHPHKDMEIITYVREGAVTHEDSLGNRGITAAGDVQVMSAGLGIVHAERNEGDVPIRLYQIWIEPRNKGNPPRWEAKQFPKTGNGFTLLASGNKADDALYIDQDAAIWGGHFTAGQHISQPLEGAGYLLVSSGEITMGGKKLTMGDGAAITGERLIDIKATRPSELVLIDLPTVHI